MMNGIEERDTVLTLADSSSEVKERKVNEGERNDIMVNLNSNSCLAPAAIIISSNDKHPNDHQANSDPTATFLASTSQLASSTSLGLSGEQGNFQVIGVAAGEGGEQILVITPLSTSTPTSQPSQDANQPLIINGLHFQAAPSAVSSSEQLNDSAILAAQFELIKSTCPTLNCDDDLDHETKTDSISLNQEPDAAATVTLQATTDVHQDMNADENVVVLYQGKQSSNLENIIESVAAEATTTATTATNLSSVSESIYNQEFGLLQPELDEDIVPNESFRKCIVCLRKRPITRDIFDANQVLNQSMAVLTAYLYIDPRNENVNEVGICPPCLDQLLNWHAFSTSIRSRHEAVRSWSAISFDNIPVNDTAVKSRLYHNPKKTADLKKHYWSQSGQHSYLARRHLTDSDWDWICEYLEKHPPPPDKERVLVQTYLHSAEKLTHIFCIYCKQLIENGKRGYLAHVGENHPSETEIRFPCELCGMLNGDDNDAYFTHWISHLYSEKCEKCNERFPNGKQLRQHLLNRHQQKRPKPKRKPKTKHIECPHCNVCLSTNSSLKKHIDYKHYEGPLQHTCSFCEKQFRWRYLLIRHERNVHRKKKELEEGEEETQNEEDKVAGDEDIAMEDATSMVHGEDKVLKRQNYSPDINPEAHSNGFAVGSFDGSGEMKMENGSPHELSHSQSELLMADMRNEQVLVPMEGVSSSSSSNFSMATDSHSQFSLLSSQEKSDTDTSSKINIDGTDAPSTNLIVVKE